MNKNKKGFTLVELMVVIVIIGVLAAIAVPRFMAASDKAKVTEGTTILNGIATLQHVHNVEKSSFLTLPKSGTGNPVSAEAVTWLDLGMAMPKSQVFVFSAEAAGNSFTATAELAKDIAGATKEDKLTIDNYDNKIASSNELKSLVGGWWNTDAANAPTTDDDDDQDP